MFGEEKGYKTGTITSDAKGRFCIPSVTGAEIGERLIVTNQGNDEYPLLVIAARVYDKKIDDNEEQLATCKNFDETKELNNLLVELGKTVVSSGKLDKQKRLLGLEHNTDYDYVYAGKRLYLKPATKGNMK